MQVGRPRHDSPAGGHWPTRPATSRRLTTERASRRSWRVCPRGGRRVPSAPLPRRKPTAWGRPHADPGRTCTAPRARALDLSTGDFFPAGWAAGDFVALVASGATDFDQVLVRSRRRPGSGCGPTRRPGSATGLGTPEVSLDALHALLGRRRQRLALSPPPPTRRSGSTPSSPPSSERRPRPGTPAAGAHPWPHQEASNVAFVHAADGIGRRTRAMPMRRAGPMDGNEPAGLGGIVTWLRPPLARDPAAVPVAG